MERGDRPEKDQRNQVIQDTVLSYAELAKWEKLAAYLQESMRTRSNRAMVTNVSKKAWTIR